MDENFVIIFNPSAFKHGKTSADITWAFETVQYDAMLDEKDDVDARDKYLLIGFDRNANAMEVLYNRIDDNTVNVFHANKLTSAFEHLLKEGE
jgi:hypothetical protein